MQSQSVRVSGACVRVSGACVRVCLRSICACVHSCVRVCARVADATPAVCVAATEEGIPSPNAVLPGAQMHTIIATANNRDAGKQCYRCYAEVSNLVVPGCSDVRPKGTLKSSSKQCYSYGQEYLEETSQQMYN